MIVALGDLFLTSKFFWPMDLVEARINSFLIFTLGDEMGMTKAMNLKLDYRFR